MLKQTWEYGKGTFLVVTGIFFKIWEVAFGPFLLPAKSPKDLVHGVRRGLAGGRKPQDVSDCYFTDRAVIHLRESMRRFANNEEYSDERIPNLLRCTI